MEELIADPDAALAALTELMRRLSDILGFGEAPIFALMAVFTRVGAAVALLPGFGERNLPMRIKLAAAIAFTLVVWPAVAAEAEGVGARIEAADAPPVALAGVLIAEAAAGIVLGLAARLLVMALQLAGAIAAQSTAVAQMAGADVTPDPMPAIGAILVVAGIALALALGLHVKAAVALVASYEVAPLGAPLPAADAAAWAVARADDALGLAVALAAPFAAGSLAYNLALGAMNRAMPQLMVAFVGAPAITAGALLLLWAAAPAMLARWNAALDGALAAPFAAP
ncbi:MAG TPA: flagellar biosynthetic protein FliR [Paracoccaceae bacterium]|nr:flagellar biosynthetic protein FliR [Paracoccaceae bacterium]